MTPNWKPCAIPGIAKSLMLAGGLLAASSPANAVVLLQGQSATINFVGTTGTPPYDFVPVNLMFSSENPFGTNETLSFSTFDANNSPLTSGVISSGSSIFTSGLGGQLTFNGVVPFSAGTALTNNSLRAVITATTGSFDLTGATASFQHIFTSGTNQNGIAGTFVAASGVPEPGTWLMLLLGFGIVGYTLRNAGSRARKGSADQARAPRLKKGNLHTS